MMYRAGVIGLGFIGSQAEEKHLDYPGRIIYPHGHTAALAGSAKTQLVAGADLNRARLDEFSRRWGVKSVYRDYKEMLEQERLDIVGVATHPSSHKGIVLDAVAAGVKGILCEKPIATNLRDAEEMLRACEQAGVKIAINTWRRWDSYYLRAKRLIDEGAIGTLKTIVGHWSGLILGTGSHGYDIISFFAAASPDWLVGHVDAGASSIEPGADAYIVYRNGVHALVNGRPDTTAHFELEIFGDTGKIRIGNLDAALWRETSIGQRRLLARIPFPQSGPMPSPMVVGVENLVSAVELGTEPSSSGLMGREALAMALAVYDSASQGNVKISFPYNSYEVNVPCQEKPVEAD